MRTLLLRFVRLSVASLVFGSGMPVFAQVAAPDAAPPVKEVQVAVGAFTRGAALPAWVMPLAEMPATSRKNPVVVRLAETQLLAGTRSDEHAFVVQRATQVNDSSALAAIGQVPLYFVPQYQQLTLHSAQILRGAETLERTAGANVRFLERESGLESGIYSGTVTAMLLIDDVRVGDTLRIVYSVRGQNPVFGGTYSDSASWDGGEPTELRRVTLLHSPQRAMQWKMHGDHRPTTMQPQVLSHAGLRALRFEGRGLEAVDEEPAVPTDYFAYRFLQFSEYGSWNEVARWADGLFPPVAELPAELKAVAARLRQLPTAEQRAVAALQWVQEEIRYFSVSMGESSHRPYAPSLVVQRRYGDCKDKTYLLVALLRELGIDARAALVSSRFSRAPARMLPTPDLFDHVIAQVRIDSAVHYLDGTRLRQRGALAQLGAVLPGASALAVDASTQALAVIAATSAADTTRNDLREEFTLDDLKGDGKLMARQVWRGNAAEALRVLFGRLTPEQLRKEAVSLYDRRYPGIRLDGEPTLSDDAERNALTLEARFVVPGLAREASGDYVMRFFPGNLNGVISLPPKMDRQYPAVVSGPPLQLRYEMSMRWPDTVSAIQDPSTLRLANDFFQAEVQRSFRGNTASMSLQYLPRAETVVPKDLPRLLEDVRKLERAIGGYFAVERSQIKSAGFFGLGKPTAAQAMAARLDVAIERSGKVIADGKLSGDDLAETLCTRAEALADRERAADGLKDANEAVRVAPAFGRAWQCRGSLHYGSGDFARALADLTKALSLGADPYQTLKQRGLARFYQGQYEQAAADFERSADAKVSENDESDALYSRMWQIWSLQRAGKPVPTEIADAARRQVTGAWPRPALAMLVGALTPQQLMAEVDKKQGDDRALTLAEAWFYVGQHHFAQGRLEDAKQAWRRAREQGITMYLEHVAAGHELARVKSP
jgi:lipoprotein NlpI